jgi:hypothetical protein
MKTRLGHRGTEAQRPNDDWYLTTDFSPALGKDVAAKQQVFFISSWFYLQKPFGNYNIWLCGAGFGTL